MKLTMFKFYTLEEVIKANRIVGSQYENPYDEIDLQSIFADTYHFDINNNPVYTALNDAYVKKLMRYYIIPNFYNYCVVELEGEELTQANSKSFWVKVFNWLYDTLQVYKPLIDIQEQELTKNKLLAGIGSKSNTRFNDTPQDAGNFEDENHASNFTHYESETNALTPIMKIKEINENLVNIYNKWCREFNKFIVEY